MPPESSTPPTLTLVEQLFAARQTSRGGLAIEGFRCRRVGRNDVWQVTRGDVVFFVTYCQSEGEFRRRLLGIELTRAVARDQSGVAAPRLEQTNLALRAIVVRRVAGTPVDALFRRAYRIDKNPLRRARSRQPFLAALRSLLDFIRAVHRMMPASRDHLWDYGPDGVRVRVQSYLDQAAEHVPSLRGLSLPALTHPVDLVPGILIGDATLGNFFIEGGRVACVDFEDIGVGDYRRDLVILRDSLIRGFNHPHYWHDDVNSLIPEIQSDDPWFAVYALEPQLLRVPGQIRQPAGRSRLTKEAEAIRHELLRLSGRAS